MNYIEKMLQDYCPNGVEWKELGEVCELKNGYTPSKAKKEFWENGTVPWFRLEDIRKNGRVLSDSIQHVTDGAVKNRKVFPANSLIVSTTATIGEVALITVPFLCNQQITAVIPKNLHREKLDIKFLFYYLQVLSDDMKKGISEGSFPIISLSKMRTFQIPLPPLKIQKEIVALLDKFTEYVTELTAELTAELTERQKQYSFYRDKLLSFEDEVYQVEWKTLGEVAGFRRGSFPQPYGEKEWYGGENSQPFVQVADISENGYCLNASTQKRISQKAIPKSVFVPRGTVLVTLQGTIGRVAITQYDAYVDRTIAIFDDYKCDIDIKYFAYQLKRKFDIEKEFARGSTLKTITKQEFSQFQIPIPPLPIQERIVQVLDNFDAVCNDLNIGLPKEIELRQKQYEYFREKLLTFTAEGVYPGQWTVDSGQWTVDSGQ
ncbi:TPA: restriction endonuclease subunit S [Streptococcus suis]|nr:restriction endonuclease subunit S [Streptococcus suis]